MRKLFIISGATGGIGSEIYEIIADNNMEDYFLLLTRGNNLKLLTQNSKEIIMDFSKMPDEKILIYEINRIADKVDEIVVIWTSATIEPIANVGDYNKEDIISSININIIYPTIIFSEIKKICNESDKLFRLIHFDSGAAYRPIDGWAMYCSSKAYMSMFLRAMNNESNDKIVSFDPGVVDTRMQAKIRMASEKESKVVGQFINLKESGSLNSPGIVARQVCERYVFDWQAQELIEKVW